MIEQMFRRPLIHDLVPVYPISTKPFDFLAALTKTLTGTTTPSVLESMRAQQIAAVQAEYPGHPVTPTDEDRQFYRKLMGG